MNFCVFIKLETNQNSSESVQANQSAGHLIGGVHIRVCFNRKKNLPYGIERNLHE